MNNAPGANGKPRPIPSLPKGAFKVVGNTGVAAQHIALVTPTKMLIIDKAEANPVKLPNGLSAYNAEYDLVSNNVRLLDVQTNTFCSGGGFLPNGTMISAGGAEARVSFYPFFLSLFRFHTDDLSILTVNLLCEQIEIARFHDRWWIPITAYVEPLR
jgi:hypothetical protein